MMRYIIRICEKFCKRMIDIIPLIYAYSICVREYIRLELL